MVEVPSEWISRARRGEAEYFDRLVEAYQSPVYNLCHRMLGDASNAEDAAQETFWRAYRGLRRYDPRRSFGTWLLSIAAHHCIDQIRRQRAPQVSLEALAAWQELREPGMGPEGSAERKEQERRVASALERLEPEDRAVIVMRYWHDLSYEELAAALAVSVSAVKSRLHRARKVLATEWKAMQTLEQPSGGVRDAASTL